MASAGFPANEASAFVSSPGFAGDAREADAVLTEITRSKEAGAKESAETAERLFEEARRLTLLLLGFGLAAGALLGFLVARAISEPTAELREAVNQIAAGKLGETVPFTDWKNEIGELARSVQVLQTEARQMEEQRWIKTQPGGDLGRAAEGDRASRSWRVVSSRPSPRWCGGARRFYLFEENQTACAGSAPGPCADDSEAPANSWPWPGARRAVRRRARADRLADPPADYVRIASGLGEAPPRAIAVLPIVLMGRLVGVVELATFEPFGEGAGAARRGLPIAP